MLVNSLTFKSLNKCTGLCLGLLLFSSGVISARPQLLSTCNISTVSFLPIADGMVADESPFDGVGDDVFEGSAVAVGLNPGIAEFRGVMEFDLSSVTSSSRIESAVLTVVPLGTAVFPGTSSVPIELFGFADDGSIESGDFNAGSHIGDFEGFGALNIPIPVDVTQFLQNQSTLGFVGFGLRTSVSAFISFGSLDIGHPARLTIELKRNRIDIKPGDSPNSINPRSRGVIPVVLLSTDTFDATIADPATIRFGATGTEAAPVLFALDDINGDGKKDLILHLRTQDTGIVCGATSACLSGETFGGQAIIGSDSIKTVGCK